jgi:hypothetical protein
MGLQVRSLGHVAHARDHAGGGDPLQQGIDDLATQLSGGTGYENPR